MRTLIIGIGMFLVGCGSAPYVPLNLTAAQYYCIALDSCAVNGASIKQAEECTKELMKQDTWAHMPDLLAQSIIDCSNGDSTFTAVTCEAWTTCIDAVNARVF